MTTLYVIDYHVIFLENMEIWNLTRNITVNILIFLISNCNYPIKRVVDSLVEYSDNHVCSIIKYFAFEYENPMKCIEN